MLIGVGINGAVKLDPALDGRWARADLSAFDKVTEKAAQTKMIVISGQQLMR